LFFFFLFLYFSFEKIIGWKVSRTGRNWALIPLYCLRRVHKMTGFGTKWMLPVVPPSWIKGMIASLTGSYVPFQRDGMRRPGDREWWPQDDVACLLGIPITRRLLPDRELTRNEGIKIVQGIKLTLCLQGWVFAHFRNLLPKIHNDDYDPAIAPLVSQWKPTRALLILDTTEMSLIRWTILMSPGGRKRDDDRSRPFKTYVGNPDGSWPTKTWGSITCHSGFLGSTSMSRLFPGLLQTLGFLRQRTWLWPSWSLPYMSSASKRGDLVPDNELWSHSRGYMRWFIRVSHPITPYGKSWIQSWCPSSSCPSLRGGYCWAAVGYTSSWPIPDHHQHQSHSGQCNGASWYVS